MLTEDALKELLEKNGRLRDERAHLLEELATLRAENERQTVTHQQVCDALEYNTTELANFAREITRRDAAIAALRDALAPFAKAGTEMRKPPLSDWLTGSAIVWSGGDVALRPADFYHAEDAMTLDAPAREIGTPDLTDDELEIAKAEMDAFYGRTDDDEPDYEAYRAAQEKAHWDMLDQMEDARELDEYFEEHGVEPGGTCPDCGRTDAGCTCK